MYQLFNTVTYIYFYLASPRESLYLLSIYILIYLIRLGDLPSIEWLLPFTPAELKLALPDSMYSYLFVSLFV